MKRAFATIAIIIAAVLVIGLAFEFGYARISSSDYSGSSETFAYSCQYGAECPLTTGTYTYSFNGTIHTITAHSETEQENETFDHNWAMINFTVDRENENFPIVITPCYEHVPTNLTANAAPQASLGCHNAPTHPINITGIFSNVTIAYIADNESILQVELAQRGSVAMVIQSSVDPERVLADGIPISSWTYSHGEVTLVADPSTITLVYGPPSPEFFSMSGLSFYWYIWLPLITAIIAMSLVAYWKLRNR